MKENKAAQNKTVENSTIDNNINNNNKNNSNNNSNNNVLEIVGLDYFIDEVQILKNINLKIGQGEFVGLIGPNGAGKTTLLKCINGINTPGGLVKIKNKHLDKLNEKQVAREVALMNQNTIITFPFPSIDVVLAGRYPYLGFARGESIEDYNIARKYMHYTNTLKFEKRAITRVSGGERQRILFAKILTQETDIILLDEPSFAAWEKRLFPRCTT